MNVIERSLTTRASRNASRRKGAAITRSHGIGAKRVAHDVCRTRDMATTTTRPADLRTTLPTTYTDDLTRAFPLIGRALFAITFIMATPGHFSSATIAYAATQGVPFANVMVPFAGLLSLVGALGVIFGFQTKLSAWLLIAFLVPVTLTMHRFWVATDPQMAQMQSIQFMKNLGLIGGALFLAYFGAGPLSLDAVIARKKVIRA
jgi:putative oxidoreductase